ncbi:MAG: hypothetical protein GTN49_09295 [candidate division Zixibacteria bacterium]|nr:hypothetical protein [candidate division Zixibacteria bacterium]
MELSQETNKKILFLFVDGLGIGPPDAAVNPLLVARLPHLESLIGSIDMGRWREGVRTERASLAPLDATLGVAGPAAVGHRPDGPLHRRKRRQARRTP